MNLVCKKCNHANPEDSRYCSHCGNELKTTAVVIQSDTEILSIESQKLREQFNRELNEEALQLKFEMLEAFQEKATKWVKIQFVAATSAISVVVAVLAYAGFNGFDASKQYQALVDEGVANVEKATGKYDQLVKKSETAIFDNLERINGSRIQIDRASELAMVNIAKKSSEFDKAAKDAEEEFNINMAEFRKFDTTRIDDYQKKLSKTVAEIEVLQKQTKDQIAAAKVEFGKIERLENSRFRVIVHYRDTTKELYQNNIASLEAALAKKGFVINKNDIANVRVDRQEILSYSGSIHISKKVREIRQLLSESFQDIPIRYESAGSLDSMQVMIKLCPQGSADGGSCKIEAGSEN